MNNLPKDGKPFYLIVVEANNDATIGIEDKEPEIFVNKEAAITHARVLARDDDLPSYVFECRAVCHAYRKDIHIDMIDPH